MRFDYHRPTTLDDALELLLEGSGASRPITYGSDLLVWTKSGVRPSLGAVIDLTGVEELARVEAGPTHLELGPCLSLGEAGRSALIRDRFPALAAAIGTMGSVQLREGASLGGNICSASPAGDSGPPLLAYQASMVLAGPAGRRELQASEFFIGPGQTAIKPGELLVMVKLPWPSPGAVGTYLKGARRQAVDLALVSVAAVAWPEESTTSGFDLALGLGAVAPTPVRAPAAEALVRERGLDIAAVDSGSKEFMESVRAAARPIDDVRSSARYRLQLLGELARRAVTELAAALETTRHETSESTR